MRQYIAAAAMAAISAAQSGADLGMVGTNDERPSTISGDWADTVTDANRDMYKVEKVDDWDEFDDDALNDTIGRTEPVGDGESRPLCAIAGFENKEDPLGPSDQCCRIYEYSNFKGRFIDFCV